MTSSYPIRCPRCGRMLGRATEHGVEVKVRGRLRAAFPAGELVCDRCGDSRVRVEPPQQEAVLRLLEGGGG